MKGVLLAVAAAAAGFLLGWAAGRGGEGATPRAPAPPGTELAEARRELEEERTLRSGLERELARFKAREAPPPPAPEAPRPEPQPAPAGPPTDAELKAGVDAFGAKLDKFLAGNKGGRQAAEDLRALLARATPEQLAAMIGRLGDEAEDMEERLVLAHVLAQSGNPDAIGALQEKLRQPEAGLMLHRFASHGLAFCDAPGIEPFLADLARTFPDRGVRANISFGLNRRGVKEGAELYFAATDEAFAAGDPAALQYLGGLSIMGEGVRPGIRERLLTYTDEQALVVLIEIAKGSGDREAVPNLEKLAYDSARPAAVRKAAEAAIRALAAK